MATPDPVDDPTIPRDATLLRRVFPAQEYKDPGGGSRPESGAFREHVEGVYGLSVYVAQETTKEEALKPGPGMYLVEFPAKAARDAGCKIVRDRLPENDAHALIFGDGTSGRLTKKQASLIARQAKFVIPDLPISSSV